MDTGDFNLPRQGSQATHNTIDHEKNAQSPQGTRHSNNPSHRIRSHMRKFRWIYVTFGTVFLVLVVLLPLLFATVIPRMIRDAINKSELPLLSGSIEAVSPTHVRFGLSTRLRNPQNLGVTLDAFPLELYNTESHSKETIVTLAMPQQFLRKQSTTVIDVEPQTLEIHSQTQLRIFLARAFLAQHTTIGVRGSTRARVLGAGYAVTLDKAVPLAGLHGLKGMKVDTLLPTPPGGSSNATTKTTLAGDRDREHPLINGNNSNDALATLRGALTVPNPSRLHLALGNVTYNVYSAGMLLGEAHVNHLRLAPGGDQAIPYEGTLNVDDIVDEAHGFAAFAKIMETVTDAGRVPFDIVGSVAYVNGEHIPYLDGVLSQIKLRVAPCLETIKAAIPTNNQFLWMVMFVPLAKMGICDPNAAVSGGL